MKNKKLYHKKNAWLLPVFITTIILLGLTISLIQIRERSSINTKADILVTNNDPHDCGVPPGQLQILEEEQKLFDQINAYREQNGLNKLAWSNSLIQAAKWMSNDMLQNNYLRHTDSLGRDLNTRLTDCGYSPFISAAENIDSGTGDSVTIFQAWKHSPPQNANILNKDFKEAGIALANTPGTESYYWTLNLGNSALAGPTIVITETPTPYMTPTGYVTSAPTPSTNITPTPTSILPSATPSPIPTKRARPTSAPKLTLAPTPTFVPFTPNPFDMQLFITAKITGIGKKENRSPKHLTRHVTVGIYDMKNQLVKEGNGFIIYDRINLFKGTIHFGPVNNGMYFIKIQSPRVLKEIARPTFQILDSGRLNFIPEVAFMQGDINDDNKIDITDYNLALPCFQDKRCQDKELIDFNDDGTANIIDYNILLRNYRQFQGD